MERDEPLHRISVHAEMDREKAALIKADDQIARGQRRLEHQVEIALSLRVKRFDAVQAERLAATMRDTLVEWRRHRTLILNRIAHLEVEKRRAGVGRPLGR